MALYDFRIGTGPDFMMTKGKVIYPHRAEVTLIFDNGAKTSVTVTNPSLSALIVALKEKLVAIGWSSAHGYAWTAFAALTTEVHGTKGSGIIVFKFPEDMTKKLLPIMVQNIIDYFK